MWHVDKISENLIDRSFQVYIGMFFDVATWNYACILLVMRDLIIDASIVVFVDVYIDVQILIYHFDACVSEECLDININIQEYNTDCHNDCITYCKQYT